MAMQNYEAPDSGDDVDEEELSEDYDDEFEDEEGSTGSVHDEEGYKHKRPRHGGFILDEAEVDESEEEESSEGEEGYEQALKEARARQERERAAAARKSFADLEDEKKLEELVSRYEHRRPETFDETGRVSTTIERQRLMPGINNPYLWMVRCQMGDERKLAFLLMRKALKFAINKQPLHIKSVIQLDRLKGFVYIEAFKASHVRQAIEGIYGFRFGMYSQKMVPIEEMTDVLRVVSTTIELKPNTLVRFKRGLYRGDLAFVQAYDSIKGIATLKIIPRIDYNRLAQVPAEKGINKRFRPVAALFDRDKANAANVEFTSDRGQIVCKGRRFKNGYLIKRVPISSLTVEQGTPSLAELQKFNILPDSDKLADAAVIAHNLSIGDIVRVVQGELASMLGIVVSIGDSCVNIKPKDSDVTDTIQVTFDEVIKYFTKGDHVKVIHGESKNISGLVVNVDDDEVVVLSDNSLQELRLLARDLQLCDDRTISYDPSGQFAIHDLVQVDPQTVGVVVGVDQAHISVLDQFNNVQKIPSQNLSKKALRSSIFVDSRGHRVMQKDRVRIIDGHYKGMRGQMKYFFRGFVFIYSNDIKENANITVTRHKNVTSDSVTPNTSINTSSQSWFTPKSGSSSFSQPGYVGIGRSPMAHRFGDKSGDRLSVGSTVKIISGLYKGYIGIVKDPTPHMARVELHAQCKTINVQKKNLKICDSNDSSRNTKSMISDLKPTTADKPFVGSRTPMHDVSRTPKYGSATPGQDGSATPLASGSAWGVPTTPRFQDDDDRDSLHVDVLSSFSPQIPSTDTSMLKKRISSFSPRVASNTFDQSLVTPAFGIPTPNPNNYSSTLSDTTTPTPSYNITLGDTPAFAAFEPNPHFTPGTEVIVSKSFPRRDLAGRYSVVLKYNGKEKYTLKSLNDMRETDGRSIEFIADSDVLRLADLKIGRRVKVCQRGKELTGTLINIDINEGAVELDDSSNLKYGSDEGVSMFLLENIVSFVPVD